MFASLFRNKDNPSEKKSKQQRKKERRERGEPAPEPKAPPWLGGRGASVKGKKGKKGAQKAAQQPLSKKQMKKQRLMEEMRKQEQAAGPKKKKNAKNSLTSKMEDMSNRLKGSRFRWLNDQLYHTSGEDALDLFQKDPSLAQVYHEGYRAQRAKWPSDPLLDILRWIRREVPKGSTLGDFGCGEARLAKELQKQWTVHSFDLVAVNERVTPCNIANVPLPDESLDVAVFCLALMGVDWPDFVREARRCLVEDGRLYIAEVESRFADEEQVVAEIEGIGFQKVFVRKAHGYFVEMLFKVCEQSKETKPSSRKRDATAMLTGCKYRRR